MNRRGFTLTELIMTLSVTALMGVALTRILISDSRFISRQDAMLTARQGARAALNVIVPELSMVTEQAFVAASRDSMHIRVPVASGITCRLLPSTSTRIVSFLPVDSVAWASLDTTGMYWRQRSGAYQRINMTMTAALASDSSQCQADSVRTLPGGKLFRITPTAGVAPESLAIAMLYSRLTYKFAASTDLPGRIGLWRKNWVSTAEELVAPFDTSARFAYLIGGPKTATLALRTATVTGAGLDSIRGVEVRLYAASEKAAQGTSAPQVFRLRTRVLFANKVN